MLVRAVVTVLAAGAVNQTHPARKLRVASRLALRSSGTWASPRQVHLRRLSRGRHLSTMWVCWAFSLPCPCC